MFLNYRRIVQLIHKYELFYYVKRSKRQPGSYLTATWMFHILTEPDSAEHALFAAFWRLLGEINYRR